MSGPELAAWVGVAAALLTALTGMGLAFWKVTEYLFAEEKRRCAEDRAESMATVEAKNAEIAAKDAEAAALRERVAALEAALVADRWRAGGRRS